MDCPHFIADQQRIQRVVIPAWIRIQAFDIFVAIGQLVRWIIPQWLSLRAEVLPRFSPAAWQGGGWFSLRHVVAPFLVQGQPNHSSLP